MKEQDFYRELIREKLINDRSVKTAVMMNTRQKQFPWKRALSIAAVCILAVLSTVLVIPNARAEVLSWFGIATPEDLLMTKSEDRPSSSHLNSLIASPVPEDCAVIPIPIDRTGSKAVNSEAALRLSDELYENCDILLGDALYDGSNIYQSIRLNGLAGLYLLEEWVGGNAASVPVDPLAMIGIYGDTLSDEELSGKRTLYEHPIGRLCYELADGTCWGGAIDLSIETTEPIIEAMYESGVPAHARDGKAAEAVNAFNRSYLYENGLVAVAVMSPFSDCEPSINADGILTAKVFYTVGVIEEDRGDGIPVPETELFSAQIGTISIDMLAWKAIPKRKLCCRQMVAWTPETVPIGARYYDFGNPDDLTDDVVSFSKYRVDMQGVSATAETADSAIDALGIHEIRIRFRLPDSWTDEQREAFKESIFFRIRIDGDSGAWNPSCLIRTVEQDGSVLCRIPDVNGVLYDRLHTVRSLTLIPVLSYFDSIAVRNELGESQMLCPSDGETAVFEMHAIDMDFDTIETEYPDCAITLYADDSE